MDKQIVVTVKFTIPESEVADIDYNELKQWLRFTFGEIADLPQGNQFSYYEIGEFNPKIKEASAGTKKII